MSLIYERNKQESGNSGNRPPFFSIITVCLNAEKFIEDTILSVINQTYNNIEYIIIDGGSKDRTVDIIKRYENKVDYWVSEQDNGIFDAMNKGIEQARGEWLNYLNAGDKYSNDEALSQIMTILRDTQCIYGFGYNEQIILDGKKYQRTRLPQNIIYDMPTCHNSMFFPNEQSIKYRLEFSIASDYHYFREYVHNGYKFIINDFSAVIWQRGGFSDKWVFRNIKDRLTTNYKYSENVSSFFCILLFYCQRILIQTLKRILPITVLDRLRKLINFEYTIADD